MTKSTEYYIWSGIIARCLDEGCPAYRHYGGRGITVHPSIRKFSGFLSVMGKRPSAGHSIDRIDNNGNYEPGNMKWATRKQQARNQRTNRLIAFSGKTQTLAEWAEEFGIKQATLLRRLDHSGWTLEKAMTSEIFPPGLGKLTAEKARQIFLSEGKHKDIAKIFGVQQTIVSRIKSGKRWGTATASLRSPS